jgi:type I restriction enzyme M protein
LTDADIQRIAGTFQAWRGEPGEEEYADVAGFCASVGLDDIATRDFVLTPGRYVGNEAALEDGEPLDEKVARLTREVREGFQRREELQEQVLAALGSLEVR